MKKILASFFDILFDRPEHDRFWRRESFSKQLDRIQTPIPLAKGPAVDTSSVVVQLKGDPLSTYSATKPAAGRKIDFNKQRREIVSRPAIRRTQRIQKMAASHMHRAQQ